MHPRDLISALVAPNLSHLYFTAVIPCDGLSTIFGGFESKFRGVHHLVLDAHCRNTRFLQDDPGWLVSCGPLGVPGVSDVPQDERLLRVVYGTPCAVAAAAKAGGSTDVTG